MYVPDLDPIFLFGPYKHTRAVGWLDARHPYTQGPVPTAFLDALKEHVRTAWQPLAAGGFHTCELCLLAQNNGLSFERPCEESSNVLIPAGKVVYLAPGMIVHYIATHRYKPPDEFIQAVLNAPAQQSAKYEHLMAPFNESFASLMNSARRDARPGSWFRRMLDRLTNRGD